VFFHLIKLLFSGFLPFKGNFVCGQNNSKYRGPVKSRFSPLGRLVPNFQRESEARGVNARARQEQNPYSARQESKIWRKVHTSVGSMYSIPWHFSPVRLFTPVSFNLKTLWLREDRSLHCVAATALFWVAFSKRLYTWKIKHKHFPLLTVISN